jgi:hypothetical protein
MKQGDFLCDCVVRYLLPDMKKIILFITILSLCLFSCDGYEKAAVSPDYISSLNKTVSEEHSKGAAWTNSPEEIVKHLYSTERNPRYKTKSKSASACEITVESGPYDDELLGERYILYFRLKDGLWTIVDLKHETLRRL